jgi:CRISPR-associated protein Cas1
VNNRILDFSADGAYLSVKHEQLVVKREDVDPVTIPLEDVAVVLVSHPSVVYTQAVLSELMRHGGAFVACDHRRMPSGMMLPMEGHHLQQERFEHQVGASLPLKKRAWQQVAQAKVSNQAAVLERLHGTGRALAALSSKVQSGDPDNIEGQAARKYWQALFPQEKFLRGRDEGGANDLLNYGYGVVRAIVARALVGSGLHPSLGIHHHNRYDAFCLADDLMEPFRPVVDEAVAVHVQAEDAELDLNHGTKRMLLEAVGGRVDVDGESRTLFDAAAMLSASLALYFQGRRKKLTLPRL